MKLRGLNPQNAELITNVNQEVYDTAAALMGAQGMVVFEEALIRSGQRSGMPGAGGKAIFMEITTAQRWAHLTREGRLQG